MNSFKKFKIALIVDRPDWAFENISKQIARYLNDRYEIDIYYFNDYKDSLVSLFIDLSDKKYDLIHIFWRKLLFEIFDEIIFFNFSAKNRLFAKFSELFINTKITTSVYDHLYIDDINLRLNYDLFDICSAYSVSSKKLNTIYRSIPEYKNPDFVIEDGVDPELFYPKNLDRLTKTNKPLVIGWAGNSTWGIKETADFKGFNTIINPAINELMDQGYNIKSLFADRKERFIPHSEMIDYYSSIDVLVCTSVSEGTPNPVLEAMACGVPVISTDVGIVSQVFGEKQREFILYERSVNLLKDKIIELISSPQKRLELSQENIRQIQSWQWKHKCEKFHNFFRQVLLNEDRAREYKKHLMKIFNPDNRLVSIKDSVNNCLNVCNIDKKDRICFYGAGKLAEYALTAFDFSELNIIGVIDGDKNKLGSKIGNYQVYTPDYTEELNPDVIIMNLVYKASAIKMLMNLRNEKNLKYKILANLYTNRDKFIIVY